MLGAMLGKFGGSADQFSHETGGKRAHHRSESVGLPSAILDSVQAVGSYALLNNAAPAMAFSAGRAGRGEKLAEFVGVGSFFAAWPILSATMATAGTGFAAPVLALYPAFQLQGLATRAVRKFTRTGMNMRRLEMGGDYYDSLGGQQARQRAMQDMSGALMSARRVLGQEARLMHR